MPQTEPAITTIDRRKFQPVKQALGCVTAALTRGVDAADDGMALRDLDTTEQLHPLVCAYAAQVVNHLANDRTNAKAANWKVVHRLAAATDGHDRSSPIRMMFAYAFALEAIHRVIAREGLVHLPDFQRMASELMNAVDETAAAFPAAAVYDSFRGKVASLTDRAQARAFFQAAIATAPEFVSLIGFDRGLHTYYQDDEVPPADYPGDDGRALIREALRPRNDVHTTLMWSVDEKFLRAFGSYWFHLAPHYSRQGYRFVFLIADSDEIVNEAKDLARNIAAFQGFPSGQRKWVDLVPIPTPAGVANAPAFYAAARLLYANAVLYETQTRLITIDADMTLVESLDRMIDTLDGDLGCPLSRGVSVLSPWRRYMAGTFFANPGSRAHRILERMADYITHGLQDPNSWMLDQSTLSFAAEMTQATLGGHFTVIGKRSFQQDVSRKYLEWRA